MRRSIGEFEPQSRVWLAFAVPRGLWKQAIWPPTDIPKVKADLIGLAKVIARHAPVTMLVPEGNGDGTRLDEHVDQLDGGIDRASMPLDDLWIRDTGPIFVKQAGGLGAVDCNFNGWGRTQPHDRDTRVAGRLADLIGAPRIHTWLTTEGGALEFDGEGTVITTDTSLLNSNRNPGRTAPEIEGELRRLFGTERVIWLRGRHTSKDHDITDGHVDFYARFARPGLVLCHLDETDPAEEIITRAHYDVLSKAKDASGRSLEVLTIRGPKRTHRTGKLFCSSYLNFLLLDRAVIAPCFGDPEADAAAKATLRAVFPDRTIEMVAVDNLASGGGGIHCATLNQPAAKT